MTDPAVAVPFSTFQGGGCQSADIVIPAWVSFTGSGPVVTSFTGFIQIPAGGNGDLELDCVLPVGQQTPAIDFGNQAAAEVTGTAGPTACEQAIRTDPLEGSVPLSALYTGRQFSVTAASGLRARVSLQSANDTTDDLTWTVTAWSPPA